VLVARAEAGQVGEASGDAQCQDQEEETDPDDDGTGAGNRQRKHEAEGEQAQWPAQEEEGGVPAESAVARGPC